MKQIINGVCTNYTKIRNRHRDVGDHSIDRDNKHYIGLSREIANRKIFSHENIIHYETLARQVIKSLNTLKHSN